MTQLAQINKSQRVKVDLQIKEHQLIYKLLKHFLRIHQKNSFFDHLTHNINKV